MGGKQQAQVVDGRMVKKAPVQVGISYAVGSVLESVNSSCGILTPKPATNDEANTTCYKLRLRLSNLKNYPF